VLGAAAVVFGIFLAIESHVRAPLVPLRLFKLRNLSTASGVGVLWSGAMFAWFFMAALYLQLVLGYSPLQIGLAFLPGNLIMGALSIGLSAKLVMRYGIRKPLATGLLLASAGLLLLVRAPVDGSFAADVLPSMILLGLGAGMAFNPVLLAAMGDVGLAVLASAAASRTSTLVDAGHSDLAALTGGYHLAFLLGAVFAAAAAVIGATLIRESAPTAHEERSGELAAETC
jgi:hypothetical protein